MDVIIGEIESTSSFKARYIIAYEIGAEACKHGYCLFEGRPNDILEVRNMAEQDIRIGVVMLRGTGSNPPTGGSDSGFTMSFEFNGLSQSGVLCGEDFIRYRPFKDSPEEILVETEFDWGALVGRVAFGLFWVTVVSGLAFYGASLVFTGGATAAFAPWVIGGLTAAGGAWYVEDLARKDYARGEVSPLTAYGASGLIGSTKGALAGGAFFMAPYAAPVLLSDPGIMYVENMLPASEDIVLGLTETALYATAFTNMIIQGSEMAEIGTGKNPVKAYLGEETYNKTGEWSEMGARTILIGGLCNPDFYVKNKETAHFDQIWQVGEGGSNSQARTTRVGRWMSQAEYDKMVETGKVQMSGDNKVHVANPADANAFGKQAPNGSIYVEFDVPSNTISKGGMDGWGIINGPGSMQDRLNAKKGLPRITEMPNADNIKIEGAK